MTAIDLGGYRFAALIFDCDGTLAETAPLHQQSMAHAVAEQGHTMARDWYFERVGLSRADLLLDFEATHDVSLDRQAAVASSKAYFKSGVHQVRPIAPVLATARQYSGRLPMAVASGAEGDIVRVSLTAIGASDLFDHIVTITEIPVGKPAPDLFLEAARRLGFPPQDCLVFEDSTEGLDAANRAGMQAIDIKLHVGLRVTLCD